MTRNAKLVALGMSWAPRLFFLAGVVAFNLALAAPAARAQDYDDQCWGVGGGPPADCYCDSGSRDECLFDDDCQTLYPGICTGSPQ